MRSGSFYPDQIAKLLQRIFEERIRLNRKDAFSESPIICTSISRIFSKKPENTRF